MSASVVVPAYNAARTIADMLDSLRAQSCRMWEAIILDVEQPVHCVM